MKTTLCPTWELLHIREMLQSFRIKCRSIYAVGRSFRPSGGLYALALIYTCAHESREQTGRCGIPTGQLGHCLRCILHVYYENGIYIWSGPYIFGAHAECYIYISSAPYIYGALSLHMECSIYDIKCSIYKWSTLYIIWVLHLHIECSIYYIKCFIY